MNFTRAVVIVGLPSCHPRSVSAFVLGSNELDFSIRWSSCSIEPVNSKSSCQCPMSWKSCKQLSAQEWHTGLKADRTPASRCALVRSSMLDMMPFKTEGPDAEEYFADEPGARKFLEE